MATSIDCSFCIAPFKTKPVESLFFITSLGNALFWAAVLVVVLYRKHRVMQTQQSECTLLPLFEAFFYVCAVASLLELLAYTFVPFRITTVNSWECSTLHATIFTIQQFLSLCTTFMLMSHGMGMKTLNRACLVSALASMPIFVLYTITYKYLWIPDHSLSIASAVTLSGGLALFYMIIFSAPVDWVFRRPALNSYSLYMLVQMMCYLMSAILRYLSIDFGYCVHGMAEVLNLLVPIMAYRTLLLDSLYWQGKWHTSGYFRKDTTTTNILSPLSETSLIPESAVRLANAMDEMDRIPLLNHALLRIKTKLVNDPGLTRKGLAVAPKRNSVVLGAGSNARVYSGYYKDKSCAIKMMFTPELTPGIIDTVCSEAGLLGALRHPNIVEVFGICVYPPSVCLVMELCHNGSVFELLHQDMEKPLRRELMFKIARDTANAVQFLHSHEPQIIHLDIKPSNLLLDKNFTVKLADLELARRIVQSNEDTKKRTEMRRQRRMEGEEEDDEEEELKLTPSARMILSRGTTKKWLVPDTINWTAPELLSPSSSSPLPTYKADIYSLAMVIFEIFSRKVPYTDYFTAAVGGGRTEPETKQKKHSSTMAEDATSSLVGDNMRVRGEGEGGGGRRAMAEVGSDLEGLGLKEEEWKENKKDGGSVLPLSEAIVKQLYRPAIPSNLPKSIAELVEKGWSSDPSKRPTAREIYLQIMVSQGQEIKEGRPK